MSLKDRLRLKLKANFLMYGYNAGPPMGISIYTVLPYCAIVRTDNHQFFLREEKGLTEKLCAYALDRKKTCSHANLLLRLLSYASSRRRICENHIYLYFIPHITFSSHYLHAVTFLHVLHFNVLRRQIEIETESKN